MKRITLLLFVAGALIGCERATEPAPRDNCIWCPGDNQWVCGTDAQCGELAAMLWDKECYGTITSDADSARMTDPLLRETDSNSKDVNVSILVVEA